jgi:alkanesulfonate monooxygenase SsuD/methylene tetrahydromethanopterin reductase-like flavin-dependent oxidoreductase (luciferase family)
MVPLSILDLAAVGREETIAESFAGSVELAQAAERGGYERVWYAEHHNISSIASSATAVLSPTSPPRPRRSGSAPAG